MKAIRMLLSRIKPEYILIVILIEVSAVAHGYNMFNFPYYENDEGTYMSQAWSVITHGQLAPYTYWYDHAPLGWLFIAGWTFVTGGFFTFGASVNSGRAFMLVIHIFSTILLYLITKKLSKSTFAGTVAVLLFSLSPLAIYFQRRVLLDNIMVFWVLLSFYFVTLKPLKIGTVLISSIFMAIAVLTKESAVFFVPGVLMIFIVHLRREYRVFSIFQWCIVFGSVVSLYLLYALLKGELFPTGTFLGGTHEHVSLLSSLKYQMSRSNGAPLWDISRNQFVHETIQWFAQDMVLVILSGASVLCAAILSYKKRQYLPYVVAAVGYIAYLARGGNIIEFYILPLIPFVALLTGVVCSELLLLVSSNGIYRTRQVILMAVVVFLLGRYYVVLGGMNRGHNLYSANQTKAQVEALQWIRENVDPRTVFIFDDYGFVDLKSHANSSGVTFANAQWYQKVDSDPAIRYGALNGDATGISMIAMTPQTHHDIAHNNLYFLKSAADAANKVKVFWSEGWGVEIWETNYPSQVLARSWESYKSAFITKEGRVIDLEKAYETTSEMQGYSLLRAVWMDDKPTFDLLWIWTKNNLQKDNKLFARSWREGSSGVWGVQSPDSSLGADTDIALALSFASKQWQDPEYLASAQSVVSSIRTNEIMQAGQLSILVPSDSGFSNVPIKAHIADLSPYAYRVFSEIDQNFNWLKVVDSTYTLLDQCAGLSPRYISPEWCGISLSKGRTVYSEVSVPPQGEITTVSQLPWKIALDYNWSKDKRAKTFLEKSSFYTSEFTHTGKVVMSYDTQGHPQSSWESLSGYTGVLSSYSILDADSASKVYTQKIMSEYYHGDTAYVYWEDPDSIHVQNWAWLATALYSNRLPNVWDAQTVTASR